MIKNIGTIQGLGDILLSTGSFVKQIDELEKRGVEHPYLPSVKDVANIRYYSKKKMVLEEEQELAMGWFPIKVQIVF